MRMKDLPPLDFVIVGAPKCGTSYFQKLLDSHPEICFGAKKDHFALATDFVQKPVRADHELYLSWFEKCDSRKTIGESSVYYLYSDEALRQLVRIRPLPKIFVLVRNPLEQVASYHAQLRLNDWQPVKDIVRAWQAPKEVRSFLDYQFISDYLPRLDAFEAAFGENLRVIFFMISQRTQMAY